LIFSFGFSDFSLSDATRLLRYRLLGMGVLGHDKVERLQRMTVKLNLPSTGKKSHFRWTNFWGADQTSIR